MKNKLRTASLCIHAGYKPKNGEPIELPIIQSTTFKYDDSDEMAQLFDLKKEGYFYTRLQNPTNDAVAAKIAALEGGVGCVLTSSGQAANFYALFNICEAGGHIVTSNEIYGGTFNLFGVTLKKLGIECTFVSPEASEEEIQQAFRPNTKVLFGETISNPGCAVLDIEKFARIAHRNGVPLVIDNTFATPVNCRPFEWGADIVTHSTTKSWMAWPRKWEVPWWTAATSTGWPMQRSSQDSPLPTTRITDSPMSRLSARWVTPPNSWLS